MNNFILLNINIYNLQDPVILLPDISHSNMIDMVDYIYSGYTCMTKDHVDNFLSSGERLEIVGLVQTDTEEMEPQDLSVKKRRRVEEESDDGSCLSSYVDQVISETDNQDVRSFSQCKTFNVNQVENIFQASLKYWLKPQKKYTKMHKQKAKDSSTHSKVPTWSQSQLQEAIEAVITQKLRFTQASSKYGIPKGTLYDNILGKSKRMKVLEVVGLTESQELSVLEFCCQISSLPYNRRTSCSLKDVRQFIMELKRKEGEKEFHLSKREAFKWWWAFTKKHNIISLHYEDENGHPSKLPRTPARQSSPENIFHLLNCPSSLPITIPTSSLPLFPHTAHSAPTLYTHTLSLS